MNEQIENVLRRAPQPKAPAGLLEKLRADIVVPRVSLSHPMGEGGGEGARPFLRRWLPAFSFSAFLLASLVAIAVQANILSELRRENRQLQLSAGEAEQARLASAASQTALQLRLEQLRKDAAEVERLREEVAQLRAQGQELAVLRAENQRLKTALQASASQAGGEEDPFGAAQEKSRSVICVSNLKQVGLAARMWANDHGEVLPPDVLAMQNELNSPKILTCPSDAGRTRASTWSEFGPANLSYEFLAAGVSEGESPHTIITRCPIHDHVGFLDGSVAQKVWKRAVQKNGRWIIEANASRQQGPAYE